MEFSGSALIKQFRAVCQRSLFPFLEEELGPLSEACQLLASAFSMLNLEGIEDRRSGGRGRPRADRLAILRAFLAKSALNLCTTRQLLDRLQTDAPLRRLCGWERRSQVPSEAVFSRAFAEMAESGELEQVQKELVAKVYQGHLVGHVIRDATAIEAREKATRKSPPAPEAQPKRRRGRPRKGEARPPAAKTRLERQPEMSLEAMLEDLPRVCDRGVKMGTNGLKHRWVGYKLHWDVSDSEVPLSCVLTSASLHDSQVAIPLATMTAQRVTACYELMDAGYHSERIQAYSEGLGHVVLIPDVERQGKEAMPMAPAQKQRYGLRTLIERMTGRLKDEFGGGHIRVRGHRKVMAHLMLGVLMLAVDQLLRLAS
jgi:transposase